MTVTQGTMAGTTMPQVGERGLDRDAVRIRVEQGQTNHTDDSTSRSVASIIRANVFTLFNGIILTAMIVVLLTGSWKDAVFGLVIIINTAIGIVTELRAKVTLDRLSILVASPVLVRRNGDDVEIAPSEIVLGDLVWIRAGEQVPADATILHTWGLELDESMLTGESRTVRKQEGESVYSGSTAVSGMALVHVDAVGEHSYAAGLTAQAKVYKRNLSDLSRGINTILRVMSFVVVPLCLLLIWSQLHTVGGLGNAIATGAWRQAVVSAVAGVVGMIPEGLVLLTSLNFAIAAMRLARHHTLVQDLESVETLARVDCLNLDKTGTITDGGIVADALVPATADDWRAAETNRDEAVQATYDLCNEENPNATGRAAMELFAAEHVRPGELAARIPFSSSRKWSAIVRADGTIWIMGAPEVLARGFVDAARNAGSETSVVDTVFAPVLERVQTKAAEGHRVLLIARAHLAQGQAAATFADSPALPAYAQPEALLLCSERIRSDAEATLRWFRDQGVRCRVISGDNPATVRAIAANVKLTGDREPVAVDAHDLPQDIDELARALERIDVVGRVLPEQKQAIVKALHASHHVVAMTGDGVNDTLALKEADLGVAMGNAAPATKAVAELVLVDSKFSHLPDVVARGRQVMANMERVASLFLTKTVYSALISLGVVLLAMPFPYLPRHISYIGALTIGMPAFILALAPNTRRYIPGFLGRVVRFALPGGIAVGLSVLIAEATMPGILGWNLSHAADLAWQRSCCAMIVFVLGVLVLALVARPLASWRGVLVAVFAAAGVIGLFIPPVADFFALHIPQGGALVALMVALLASVAIFVLCQLASRVFARIFSHNRQTRQS
ncbi:E1-E2 ATPase [Bifidobacterium boum]|uniref:E1-E2 ATPase n=2 Tax=Bifidobacterium boum TaxID=78343 RepID=A0A086ZPD5_9BIFI|nr:E1-E2 ATPase [Bifidobacterium boum]